MELRLSVDQLDASLWLVLVWQRPRLHVGTNRLSSSACSCIYGLMGALVITKVPMQCGSQSDDSFYYRCRNTCAVVLIFLCFTAQPLFYSFLYVYFFIYPLLRLIRYRTLEGNDFGIGFLLGFFYTVYWVSSLKWPSKGGINSPWFRSIIIWKWAAEYLPAKLVASDELKQWSQEYGRVVEKRDGAVSIYLPRDANYLVGYHPHGVMAFGAMGVFGNDSLGFTKMFPGIRRHAATLNLQFLIPLYREFVMFGGECYSVRFLEFV